jgi:ParB family chromosome partitioning protein
MSVRQLEEAVKRSKLQTPEISAAKRAAYVIPEPVKSVLSSLGVSLKVTGNPKRLKVSIDGLNKGQMESFLRFLEERGDEIFPGK